MALKGSIARLVLDKGFGFIARTDGDVEYFFHRTAVENATFEDLLEGQAVTFKEGNGTKGPRAAKVFVE